MRVTMIGHSTVLLEAGLEAEVVHLGEGERWEFRARSEGEAAPARASG
jgi:hypothetical protein